MESDFEKEHNIDGLGGYAQATSLLDIEKNIQKGIQLHRQGKLEEAQKIYHQILSIDPFHAQAWHLSGVVALQCDEPALSRERVATAISLNPHDASMYYNQAMALERLQLKEEAIASYDKAIAIQPDYVEAYINRGVILKAIGKLDEAISSYNSAIGIKPDSAEAYSNRGNALAEARRWMEALESYDLAISINPTTVQAHINRANTLLSLQRPNEAILGYEAAVSLQPDNALANWNLAHALLLTGDYARGWELYEWRWKYGDNVKYKRNFKVPFWQGVEKISGRKILLYAEQGLGDTIQFFRYVKLLKQMGAGVLLVVPRALVNLLKDSEDVDVLIESGLALPEFDYYSPLISLPRAFGTNLNSIPAASGYLQADRRKVLFWKERLGCRSRLKVGVVWSGGFHLQQNDRWATIEQRNISLEVFANGLKDLTADFFSLQKGDPSESEIRSRESQYWPNSNFYNYADELNDFTDTAALIENLDVILTVDTSTAHLAAAMGKPTWILNRYDTCWRWLLDRGDSPWYESVKLYRQDADRLWEPVLKHVANDLMSLCNARQ
jgi:tetratricopeptide (TPR) repeat protein